ncbi:MAG: peptidase T [Treponema sp.]|jgi:tripeptide aminopeptidase|nr:peptidase T [Treponema sp.]
MNYISSNEKYLESALNRFIKYVKTYSESSSENAEKGIFPSTQCQFEFANKLYDEFKKLGIDDVQVTKDCYVYAHISCTKGMEHIKPVCFLAHLDTVDEVSGLNVNPKVFRDYSGGEIDVSDEIKLSSVTDEYLQQASLNKETIITSDGSTLLGSDDKAGVCAIMTAVQFLQENKDYCHGTIEIVFSPDEETGHGMDKVPLELIKSKIAYTVDGGDVGELEWECFNAYSAKVIFTGKACHTGDARKNKMVNAVLVASQFLSSLPNTMLPETTDEYQGFIAPLEVSGGIEKTTVSLILRSFSIDEMDEEKRIVEKLAKSAALSFNGKSEVLFCKQYLNMKDVIMQNPEVIEKLEKAFESANVVIKNKPIRGGTDGSRLTEMGIPCPNIFTGAHNFHSRSEWCSLNQIAKASDIILNLIAK